MAHTVLLGLVYLSFVSIGLPDGMLGVAWPAIRLQMNQPLAAVGAITMTMTACSAASSLISMTRSTPFAPMTAGTPT